MSSTPNPGITLTIEQQFNITSFKTQVMKMSREQAQDMLIQMYEQSIVKEAMYKKFIKHQWGLEPMTEM